VFQDEDGILHLKVMTVLLPLGQAIVRLQTKNSVTKTGASINKIISSKNILWSRIEEMKLMRMVVIALNIIGD